MKMGLGSYIIEKKDLPKHVSMSQDQLSKCEQIFVVMYVGVEYYIPMTPEVMKVMKLFESKRFNTRMEDFFQEVVRSVYMQIRDSVGAEVHRQLSDQIKDGFETMFESSLSNAIQNKLNQKMLSGGDKEDDKRT